MEMLSVYLCSARLLLLERCCSFMFNKVVVVRELLDHERDLMLQTESCNALAK